MRNGGSAWAILLVLLGSSCGIEKEDGTLADPDGSARTDSAVPLPPPPPPGDTGTTPPPPPGDMGTVTPPPPDSGALDMGTAADLGPPDSGPPPTTSPGPVIGDFQLTFYWVAYEGDHPDGPATDLYADDCSVLASVPADFADAIALEGTGRLLDGRMLNVSGGCGCARSPCFVELDAEHPWGVGVANRPLAPFRSVAIDRAVLDIGTHYYVEELDGLTMPGDAPWGAFVHDGCVLADDVGGGIDGMHIDFFVGLREHYRTLVGMVGDPVVLHEGGERCL